MHIILIGTCILAGIVAFLNVFRRSSPPQVVRTGSILFALMMFSLALLTFLEYGEPFQWIAALSVIPLIKRVKDLLKIWKFISRVRFKYPKFYREKRSQNTRAAQPRDDEMTRHEARRLLGVAEGSTQDQIKAAHRRKMQKHHPDQGGDAEIATLINQAKDVLLYRNRIDD